MVPDGLLIRWDGILALGLPVDGWCTWLDGDVQDAIQMIQHFPNWGWWVSSCKTGLILVAMLCWIT